MLLSPFSSLLGEVETVATIYKHNTDTNIIILSIIIYCLITDNVLLICSLEVIKFAKHL